MLKVRYILIGGFLGAGKTTAIVQLAQRLKAKDFQVGLITNDQSIGLVDTALLRSQGFLTEEITGGCFCCRFNSLHEAAEKLTAEVQPDIFIAEPVGSCTDLRATVSYPLRRLYGDKYEIAPLSVLLDPVRARQVLGLDAGKVFSRKVKYIYEKQMEEADILVMNKCDLVDVERQNQLQRALANRFPQTKIIRTEARTGQGIDEWLRLLESSPMPALRAMEIDYDEYAEGEALLGWLNISATLNGAEFDGNAFLQRLGGRLQKRLVDMGMEVAHLKMTLTPETGNDLAMANLVRSGGTVELAHELADDLSQGQLIINCRAEGDPERLRADVLDELQNQATSNGIAVFLEHAEAFRPGRPTPTHRLLEV